MAAKKSKPSMPSKPMPSKPATSESAASKRFLEDIAVRGEAAEPTEAGTLPLDATHAIVEKNPDGTIRQAKRARFKLF